jgi:hypothetical protein
VSETLLQSLLLHLICFKILVQLILRGSRIVSWFDYYCETCKLTLSLTIIIGLISVVVSEELKCHFGNFGQVVMDLL